ncbi:MAG TPA: helix-turn-helix domain-containing protein [Solirubrobacteraceae bacterium]|nr:helix-turn-helix domain-containing protein [Solirubrobacteraceae bacterium]
MVKIDSARELPMAGERRERSDAAANRERILCAARKLLAEQGSDALTMQAVATAAGVGKGTVFHRFGDREGLTQALLDDYMRDFQDAFLHGPPPLGPGAPASERLEAFVIEFIKLQADHLELALAAEVPVSRELAPVYATLAIHISALVHEIDPTLDETVLAGFILSAMAPPVLSRMRSVLGVDTATLQVNARALLHGLTRAGEC